MTLTIGEQTIELPPRLQATLEADAKAQARPVADVLTDRLADSYGLPLENAVTDEKTVTDSVGVSDTVTAWEALLDSFTLEEYPGEQAETLALLRQMDAEAVAIGERAAPNFGPS